MPIVKDPNKRIEYDVKVQPIAYIQSYLHLAKLYQLNDIVLFNFTPLSTSVIPRHVTIDSTSLVLMVLKCKKPNSLLEDVQKFELWKECFNLRKKEFHPRAKDGSKFTGTIKTDGVSISICIGPQTTKGNSSSSTVGKRKRELDEPVEKYFQDVPQSDFKVNSVFIDPNKRDLLYCLDSNGQKLRYTQQQRDVETKTKKYRNIRNTLTREANMEGRPYDVCVPKKVLEPDGFNIYLRTFFTTFAEKEELYTNELFRKLRLNSYINRQKSESKFLKKCAKKLGVPENTDVFIGDWDAGGHTLKGQNPTKGVGFRKMFRQFGYKVYLVNEHKTSKTCPCCFNDLEKNFRKNPSPKPWKNGELVNVHGLLRCQSEKCQQACGYSQRFWNRDDVATMNLKFIVEETKSSGDRPEMFKRTRVRGFRPLYPYCCVS